MPILILLNPKAKISFTFITQRSGPNIDILTNKKQFERIKPYYKQKEEEKKCTGK
jgi:hypothetical protein